MAAASSIIDHPLTAAEQTRNVVVFSACTGLQYLAAPVLYVGMTQAALCNRLGASPKVANLPETAFFVMTATPVLLAWLFPGVALLKRLLVACYLATGAALALVAVALLVPVSDGVRLAAVIVQGAVSGAAMPTAIALLWEAMGRGVGASRRGVALGLAFGAGPFLAMTASLVSQELLNGRFWGLRSEPLPFPWNFVAVFAVGVPLAGLAALLAGRLSVPVDDLPAVREPLFRGAWDFVTTPLLAEATLVTILLYVGNTISANMNLYTKGVLHADPESFVGYQNALRFGCKGVAGVALGWLLTRSNPRAGILITGLLFVASQVWAMFASGLAYLFAFGLYGAGELVGVYAPNYLLAASAQRNLRRNMAYVTMMMLPAAPAGYLFGAIAGERGADGFRMSFAVCAVVLVLGLILAGLLLPKWPAPDKPRDQEL